MYYADKVSAAVDGMGDVSDMYEKKFQVTNEWCLAINNIDYVLQSLKPFATELDVELIIQQLNDTKSPIEAQRCKHTLDTVIANAIDTVKNKIDELLETMAIKVHDILKKINFLIHDVLFVDVSVDEETSR